MFKKILILICILGSAAPLLRAQPQNSDSTSNDLTAAVEAIQPGATLRIMRLDSSLIEGDFQEVKHDTLFITTGQESRAVSHDSIRTIWLRTSGAGVEAKAMAVVLGTVGTLAGLSIYSFCSGLDESEGAEDCLKFIFGGALVGVSVGALLGSGIGSLAKTWEQIYPVDH